MEESSFLCTEQLLSDFFTRLDKTTQTFSHGVLSDSGVVRGAQLHLIPSGGEA